MTVVEACLDDMDARRAAAEAVLAAPVFDIEPLEVFRPAKPKAFWEYLDSLVGVEIATLPLHGQEAIRRGVHAALGIPVAQSEADDPKQLVDFPIESPEQASRILDAIRLGQPTPMLMRYLSPRAIKACEHLQSRFSRNISTIKLILGEMGTGKTTLARLIHEAAAGCGAVPVHYCMPHVTHSRPTVLVEMMISRAELYQAAIVRIASMAAAGDVDAIEAVKRSAGGHRVQPIMTFMIEVAEQCARKEEPVPSRLGVAIANAMSAWLLAGRSSALLEMMNKVGTRRISLGNVAQSEVIELLRTHLTFFSACGVYPVWLVDEFESINGLQSGQLQSCLGYFRDVIDLLMSGTAATGAMLLLSTGDGARAIRQYPALNDRLQGSERFTLSSPTWATNAFGVWDVEQLIETLRRLYMGAAQAGDATAQGVAEYIDLLRNEHFMTLAQHVAGDATVEARVRLKSLIVGVLDLLEDGPQAFAEAVRESLAQYEELPNPSAKTAPAAQLSAGGGGQVLEDYERWRREFMTAVGRRHGPATPERPQPTAEEAVEMMAEDVFGGLNALAGSLGAPAEALAKKDTWLDNMLANPRARASHRNSVELSDEVRELLARTEQPLPADAEQAPDPHALVNSIDALLGRLRSRLASPGAALPAAQAPLYQDVDPLQYREQIEAENAAQGYSDRLFDLESMLPPARREEPELHADVRAPLERLASQIHILPLPPVGTRLYGQVDLDAEQVLGLPVEAGLGAGAAPDETADLVIGPRLDDIAADHLYEEGASLPGGAPALMRYCERRHFITAKQAAKRLAKAAGPAHLASWLSAYRDLGGDLEKVRWSLPLGYRVLAAQEDTQGSLGAVRRLVDRLAEDREMAKVTVTVVRPAPEVENETAENGGGALNASGAEVEVAEEALDVPGDVGEVDEESEVAGDDEQPAGKKLKRRKRIMVDEDRMIDPFRSVGALRHFVYTYLAARGVVPEDQWVDAMVLDVARQHFGFGPRTSRHGVQFLTPRRGLLSMFGGKTCIAEDPLRPEPPLPG